MVKKSVLALIVILILLCGCQSQEEVEPAALEGEPFAIYLVGDSQITSPDLKNYALDKIPLNAVPILKQMTWSAMTGSTTASTSQSKLMRG